MFEKLGRYHLKKDPSSYYAKTKMDKAAKEAGFKYAVQRGRPYYIEEMKPENISGTAVRIRHYLHCVCTDVGLYNETCCVALFPDGTIESDIHLVGDCPKCLYGWHPTSSVALRIREARMPRDRGSRAFGWHLRI